MKDGCSPKHSLNILVVWGTRYSYPAVFLFWFLLRGSNNNKWEFVGQESYSNQLYFGTLVILVVDSCLFLVICYFLEN